MGRVEGASCIVSDELTPDSIRLDGRTAVVTGAARGLGEAIALVFAEFGADVAICDRDADGMEATAAGVEALGRAAYTATLDVRDGDAVRDFVDDAAARLGGLHVLVNNAGGTFRSTFDGISRKGEAALVQENFTSVTNGVRAALPHLGRGASIVNVTSVEAHRGAPGFSVYAAMKAAVASFTKSLAVELGPRGIRVNAIAPDAIPTPGDLELGAGIHDGAPPNFATPLDERGAPSDAAAAAVFLASDMARFVTGTTLHLDGGSHAAAGWRLGPDGVFRP